jgi:hypothetical protein
VDKQTQKAIGRVLALATALGMLSLTSTNAQTLKQIEQEEQTQKKLDTLQNALKTIDEFDAKIDRHIKARQLICMKAVGSKSFCSCIGDGLPWIFTFDDYVAITSKSKEDNQYASLDKDTKNAYDKVAPVRDRCVAAAAKR